jgi:hypothetical protein
VKRPALFKYLPKDAVSYRIEWVSALTREEFWICRLSESGQGHAPSS